MLEQYEAYLKAKGVTRNTSSFYMRNLRTAYNLNRHLKKNGEMVGLPIPLSTYVMRHAWATIARDKGIDLSIISEGLGHDNEATTRIYLDSIRTGRVDAANRLILDEL